MSRTQTRAGSTVIDSLGLLELGTNSLKLHQHSLGTEDHEIEKVEWEVGFEIYSSGTLTDTAMEDALRAVRALVERRGPAGRENLFGLATGAFRDARNTDEFLEKLAREHSIPVRVLRGEEEARLLVQGFGGELCVRPSLLFDLGGGGLELVFLGASEGHLCKILDLGVIRIQHMAQFERGNWDEGIAIRWIREKLRETNTFPSREVYGTGGSVRALAEVAGSHQISRADLGSILSQTREEGAPSSLSPRRRVTFLPALMVVEHLMDHVGAKLLHYRDVAVGEAFMVHLKRFHKALGGQLRDEFGDYDFDLFT